MFQHSTPELAAHCPVCTPSYVTAERRRLEDDRLAREAKEGRSYIPKMVAYEEPWAPEPPSSRILNRLDPDQALREAAKLYLK